MPGVGSSHFIVKVFIEFNDKLIDYHQAMVNLQDEDTVYQCQVAEVHANLGGFRDESY